MYLVGYNIAICKTGTRRGQIRGNIPTHSGVTENKHKISWCQGCNSHQAPSQHRFHRTKFKSILNDRAGKNIGHKSDKLLYLKITELQNFFLFAIKSYTAERKGHVATVEKREVKVLEDRSLGT